MPTAPATMATFLLGFRINHRGPSPGNNMVGRGRCRSGATKKAPGERGPCEKLEVEQLLAIEGVDYATDGQHNHENRRCCHDAHAHASLLTMAIMSPQMIQTPPKINVSALGS